MNLQEKIREKVRYYCEMGGVPFIEPEFDLTGGTAGMFTSRGSDKTALRLRFNMNLAEQNPEFIERTPRHEVAHYVDHVRNGYKQRRSANGKRDIHGKYWQAIMRELGAEDISRCHSYTGVKKRVYRKFLYQCHAGHQYELTTVRHNKVQKKGVHYVCRECSSRLEYVEEVKG